MEQHPAQVALSHWHVPPTQCSPAPQAFPVPQPHVPLGLQVSALSESHAVHMLPAGPHVVAPRGVHTPASQHPFGHVAAEHGDGPHVPPSQVPLLHCTQVAPPEPQLVGAVPAWQRPLLQQPVVQVVASQVAVTQPPSWQLSEVQVEQLAPLPPQLLGEVPG